MVCQSGVVLHSLYVTDPEYHPLELRSEFESINSYIFPLYSFGYHEIDIIIISWFLISPKQLFDSKQWKKMNCINVEALSKITS